MSIVNSISTLSEPYFFYFGTLASIFIIYVSFFRSSKKLSLVLGVSKRRAFNKDDVFLVFLAIVQFVGLLLICYSSGSPVERMSSKLEDRKIRDIYFVVDVSRSMLADDFRPNRLEVAKKYIRNFIKLRSLDRIGLNIFAEKIITLSPLTFDHEALIKKADDISVGFLGNGTNIGDAVALAVSRLENSKAESKVIILLTDGVSNAGSISPGHAGEISKEKGIKIYGIGIGTSGDAFLPYKVGNRTMKQRIPGGNIDHDTLNEMSIATSGKYYKASSSAALKNVFDDIDKLETTSVEINSSVLIKYNYKNYLVFGFFIFIVSEILRRYFFRFAL